MKLKESKASKIAIAVIGCLSGAIAVLVAVAFLLTIIMRVSFIQALKNKYTYLIWCSIVAVGVLVVMIDLRVRGSRRVLKVNADLENSHFMTKKEIIKNDGYICSNLDEVSKKVDGIPIFAERKEKSIEIIMHKPIHTLVIGATGSGKTAGFVSPTIEILSRTKTKPSMVVTDPKGELFGYHKISLERQGYNVTLVDLSDVYHSTRWNPLNDVYKKTEKLREQVDIHLGKYYYAGKVYLTNADAEQAREERIVKLKDEIYVDLQDLAYTAFPVENKHDQTWQRGARDLLFALLLAFWEDLRDGYMPKEKFNLYNLYRNVTDYAKGDCTGLKEYFATREETSRARGLSNTVLVTEDRTLSSYLGDVQQYMNWLADGGIATLTSDNEVEFSDFDEKPNILFIKIPDEKENRHQLVSLMITQMYKALVEKADNNREFGLTSKQTLLRHVYFIMDEFGNIPKIEKMASIITVGRSRGIFAIPIIQDFNQIDTKYGRDVATTIRNNCNIQVFIGSNDENTRKIFSELCGKKKVKQVSYSENKDMSVSTAAQSVPLIYPNELEKLNDPDNGIIGNSIVQCLGNYPIRGVMTPVFKAKEIYGQEDATEKLKAFTFFDEKAAHYDIARRAALDMDLFDIDDDEISVAEQEQSQQVEQVGQAEEVNKVDAEYKQQYKYRILKKLAVLKSKLSEKEYTTIINSTAVTQIELLDTYADSAAESGNILLAAEIENVRSYCFYNLEKQH